MPQKRNRGRGYKAKIVWGRSVQVVREQPETIFNTVAATQIASEVICL